MATSDVAGGGPFGTGWKPVICLLSLIPSSTDGRVLRLRQCGRKDVGDLQQCSTNIRDALSLSAS